MLKLLQDFLTKYAKGVSPGRMAYHTFMFIVLVSWVSIAILITTNFPLIVEMWTRYTSENKIFVEDALVISNQVNELLDEQQVRLGVDRIYVSKFHNGKVDLSGVHFIYFSRVAEATAAGVSNEIRTAQNLPLSIFPNMLTDLSQGKCHYLAEINDSVESFQFLRNMGVNSMMVCPVMSVDNRMVGIIGVDGVRVSLNTKDVEEIEATLKTLAGVIGSLFTTRQE
jgi:hypothetical protein